MRAQTARNLRIRAVETLLSINVLPVRRLIAAHSLDVRVVMERVHENV